MSEAERKRRQDYKLKRKRWIFVQAVLLVLAVIIALGSFLVYNRMDRAYYIEYTESGASSYKVQYKENTFFDEEWLPEGQSYVSALVSVIQADLSYKLEMDTSDVAFDYTYKVVAETVVYDKTSGAYIYAPVDVLVPETKDSVSGSDSFTVNQTVFVDFGKYSAEANRFLNTYPIANAASKLLITLDVDVLSECAEFEGASENSHSVSLCVPLGEESFGITSTSSVPDGESRVLACKGSMDQNIFLIAAIISGVLAVIIAIILVAYVYLTRNEDIDYANKVRRTLSAYRSFIQQIDGEFDDSGYQVILIKTFTELLGIRDTIQSPILMSENEDETRACFLIPTNTQLLYLYEIKVDNYDEIYGIGTEENTEELLEADEAEEQEQNDAELTIIADLGSEELSEEDREQLEHDIEEALAEPDVDLSEIDFVDEIDEEYVESEEKPGVEVIAVVWPERAHKNKIYRYDPAGEVLHENDVVLVPTRDVHKDREVIRKATVAHGNHVVDPEILAHSLKKIIGVVRHTHMADAEAAPEVTPEVVSEADEAEKN